MAFFCANTPIIKCLLRKEFLYNLQSHYGEFIECVLFAVVSAQGMAIRFHAMLNNGAQFHGLPIHAFTFKQNRPMDLLNASLWNCFSYDACVSQFHYLSGLRCRVGLRDGNWAYGEYLFTIDWCAANPDYIDTTYSEEPSEKKSAHIIKLDSGHIVGYPNNRIQWFEPSFIVKPMGDEIPDYKVNTHQWDCEDGPKWITEDSDNYFYGYQKGDKNGRSITGNKGMGKKSLRAKSKGSRSREGNA